MNRFEKIWLIVGLGFLLCLVAYRPVQNDEPPLASSHPEKKKLPVLAATNQADVRLFPRISTNQMRGRIISEQSISVSFPPAPLGTNVFPASITCSPPAVLLSVLVDSTNTATAIWTNFTTRPVVKLGSTSGTYQVWFGFAWNDGTTNWVKSNVTLDTLAPSIVIVSPAPGKVSKPFIQITGLAPEPISAVSFVVSNAAGLVTNTWGSVTRRFLDTNNFKFTTNWFQCYDVKLTNGANIILLRVTDEAGNTATTNLVYDLDWSRDTNAPVVTVEWPGDNALLSGTQFSIDGRVDDETAGIYAEVIADGEVNHRAAVVERTGKFWISDLPLGTNGSAVRLIASDAAGNCRTNTLNVRHSDIRITINPVPSELLTGSHVTVSGTVSETNVVVMVNGLPAELRGNVWTRTNVPAKATGGTASFSVSASTIGPAVLPGEKKTGKK